MKKIFSSLLFVLVLCFSHFNFCYSDDIKINTDESGDMVSVSHVYKLRKPYHEYRIEIRDGRLFVIQESVRCEHNEMNSSYEKRKTEKSQQLPQNCTLDMIKYERDGDTLIITVPVQQGQEKAMKSPSSKNELPLPHKSTQ